jgi:quinol monooxygenase YgiN
MIMVEGWVQLAPGEVERFLPAADAMIQTSRQEDGCLAYAYARDLLAPDTLRISEHWRDEAALNAHFQTPHMAAFNQALARLNILAASVQVYDCEHRRTMIER